MAQPQFPQWEKEISGFWKDRKIFEQSISMRPESRPYVFYDGPPFATGLPHYGHILASTIKDVVGRYFTMRGYRVERVWGWDCHGLPIENIIEKDLNLQSKRDIEAYGIANFNEACRATVMQYAAEWKQVVDRIGRWVDMDHAYKTMDRNFMESVWWVFKQLWESGLIYEGHKAMHICPRCVTALSNFEVSQGYKEVKDISATAKFRLRNAQEKLGIEGDVHVLAWTTTPWTLPGNVLLAVGEHITYAVFTLEGQSGHFIAAKERLNILIDNKHYDVVRELKGSELVGLTYEPIFPYYADTPHAFRIVTGDFVSTEDGTGVVHIAPAFGEDDYNVGKREGVPLVQHVTMEGQFKPEVTDFAGMDVKPKDDPSKADIEVIKWLAHQGALFAKAKYEHTYPHCWRCDTPLLNYATSSWFVKVTHIKDDLLKANEMTHWVPEHLKHGRFGKWLEGARDWAISRTRYWGTPLPVWRSEDGEVLCFGSVAELEAAAGVNVEDLHKHLVDEIVFQKDGKTFRRIPEVLDCWFESGSMPYGQMHYPFENKTKFEAGFPAQFIAEGQDQTRGWFYTLHVLATALTRGQHPSIPGIGLSPAFRNVVVNGIVLAEDGKKMSKRLKNYPDPMEIIEKYSADTLRWYLASSPVTQAEDLRFSEREVDDVHKKVMLIFWNIVEFLHLYTRDGALSGGDVAGTGHVLDRWIQSYTNKTIAEVSGSLQQYNLVQATRALRTLINEISTWYVRRSRDRFKNDNDDARAAAATLRCVLMSTATMMAPFAPFITEKAHQVIGCAVASIHLHDWPEAGPVDEELLTQMETARKVVELGLALRAQEKIRIRQPLYTLSYEGAQLAAELEAIIADELNVKTVQQAEVAAAADVAVIVSGPIRVGLQTTIDSALRKEGFVREIIRAVNEARKKQGFTIDQTATLTVAVDASWMREALDEHRGTLESGARATLTIADPTTVEPAEELPYEDGLVRMKIEK